jgi:FixJ family two-component response regulator
MGYITFNRSLEIGGNPRLEAARLQQTALEGALQQAESAHPTAEEMHQRQPELDANLGSLSHEKQMVLAGITKALQNQQN